MNLTQKRRIQNLEAALLTCKVVDVPWTAYSTTFEQSEGESWKQLRDRAQRWLDRAEVPGMYRTRDRCCREALLVSFKDGIIRTEKISIGNTDPDGTTYRRIEPPKRLIEALDQRTRELLGT